MCICRVKVATLLTCTLGTITPRAPLGTLTPRVIKAGLILTPKDYILYKAARVFWGKYILYNMYFNRNTSPHNKFSRKKLSLSISISGWSDIKRAIVTLIGTKSGFQVKILEQFHIHIYTNSAHGQCHA